MVISSIYRWLVRCSKNNGAVNRFMVMAYGCFYLPFSSYFCFKGYFINSEIQHEPLVYQSKFLHLLRILYLTIFSLVLLAVLLAICGVVGVIVTLRRNHRPLWRPDYGDDFDDDD
jgi:hypothetical protein